MAHPEIAYRDCEDCCKYFYDEKTGQRKIGFGGSIRRAGHHRPPCKSCKKCEDEKKPSPEVGKAATLNRRNLQTMRAYWEQQACGGEVTDAIMRKNFGIIKGIFETFDRDVATAIAMRPPGV